MRPRQQPTPAAPQPPNYDLQICATPSGPCVRARGDSLLRVGATIVAGVVILSSAAALLKSIDVAR